jgi:hypothetical protein
MGREASVRAIWDGESHDVKALLEGEGIILRGALRLNMLRDDIFDLGVEGDDLRVVGMGSVLVLTLGAREAALWEKKLRAPPPSLASKLGLRAGMKVLVIGRADDPNLLEALAGCERVSKAGDADLAIAVLATAAEVMSLVRKRADSASIPVWCVFAKGGAEPGEKMIREALRGAGRKDNKSCSVSPELTAIRFSAARAGT